jgi:hypothetical protein
MYPQVIWCVGVDWVHLAKDRDKCWALVNTVIWCEGVDWVHLAKDRDKCWAVVNMVIILPVP